MTAPVGTILNPLRPAPRAARGLTGFRATDVVLGALAKAVPDRVPAAGEGGASMIAMGGRYTDLSSFVFVDFITGSWGGRPGKDGIDGNSPIAANLSNVPVEEIESHQPIKVERYGFLPDTGGPGKYRGGLSVIRELRFLEDEGILQIRSDRRECRPYGLNGGLVGSPSLSVINPGGRNERELPTNVTTAARRGDVLRHVTAGGGGYGDPLERDPAMVLADVLDGKASPGYAERDFGVVIDASGKAVDKAATRSLKERQRTTRAHGKASNEV